MRYTILTVALACLTAAPAAAQQLQMAFNEGLVTVNARAVPVRTILNEWAKQGGTKVVGAERVTGAPLTVQLIDVPEAQALEVILRSVAGYMAAPRSTGAGASMYDRILVLATSTAPAAAAARPTPQQRQPAQRFAPPRRPAAADEVEEEAVEEEDPNPPNPPVFTFPQQGQAGQPVVMNPGSGTPQNITINPAQPTTAPTMPIGTAQPGMISAPPPQPVQPGVVVRPPGGGQ